MKLFGWHPRTTSSRRKASFHARHGSFLVFSILFSPRADSPLSAEVTEITSPCQTATTSSTQHKHRNKMDETNFVCEGTERADERGELGALKTRRLCDGRSDFQATFQYPIGLLDWGDRNQKLAGTLHNVCRWKHKREVESSRVVSWNRNDAQKKTLYCHFCLIAPIMIKQKCAFFCYSERKLYNRSCTTNVIWWRCRDAEFQERRRADSSSCWQQASYLL